MTEQEFTSLKQLLAPPRIGDIRTISPVYYLLGLSMAQETFTEAEFWAKLDAVGEDQVRINLIKKIYGDHGAKRELALEWLRRKEESRALEASSKRDAREEETLAIAKSAKASVRYDRYIAIAAIIIASIAAHKEIMWLISSVMSWFSK